MSAKTRTRPVGRGYMPKGGAPAAQKVNDQWRGEVAAAARAASGDPVDGRARDRAIRSGVPVDVAVWAVVVASAGTLFTEGCFLWVLFS